ncbi:MAG: PglZ domain-containing protein, partial [bacterium]
AYNSGPTDPNLRHIVWITPSPFRRTQPDILDLSFLADVLRRADRILDLSLTGLLRALLPGEVFPDRGLQAYGSILSDNLEALLAGHHELRLRIDPSRPLDIHHVRALALHCLRPDIPMPELLFAETNTSDVLKHYLRLVWSGDTASQALALLQEHATQSPVIPVKDLQAWFHAPPDELALLVYVYRALESYNVPNRFNQLRGLNVVTIEPTLLEPHLDTAVAAWEDEGLRAEILRRAEASLSPEGLTDLVRLFPLPDISTVVYALRRETAPALAYGLAERFLSLALREDAVDELRIDQLPSSGRLITVETHYTDRAQAAMAIIREISFILDHLRYPFEPAPDLAKLADWYVGSRVYRLELARALAEQHIKQVISTDLRQRLQTYLDQLLGRIWDYLDKVDDNLVHLVARDYDSFLEHPRLSTYVLRDTILGSGFRPTQEHCVWILIFDGMRWDSWKEVVLPALTKHLEVVDEGKAYLSLLPSTTSVARTGLLAGSTPPAWHAANGRHTSNERILAGRLFDLDPVERDRWLRIEVATETGIVQRRLGGDIDRRRINILIYNISDDLIHTFERNLAAVNAIIDQQMQTVVNDLQRHVREGDLVVVTSDHGFVELDPDKNILVKDRDLRDQGIEGPAKDHVFYRSLTNLEHPDGLRIPFHGDDFYTVAQGRTWFEREGGRFSRYSHGGISMSEMVVPGLAMQRIVEPFVKLSLSPLPRRLKVLEKEPHTISVTVHNSGNRPTEYEAVFATNTDPEQQVLRDTLGPHEAQEISYTFTPAYSPRPTDRLTLHVTYSDAAGHQKAMPARSIGVTTEPRKDVVEIDLGGLDQLEEL